MSRREPMAHPASEAGGWGVRMHYLAGGSCLNNFSLGDVVAYDTKKDAELVAKGIMSGYAGKRLYSRVTVEKVERGAWAPSAADAETFAALKYVERAADAGDAEARSLANRMRASLSPYAPAHMRAPRGVLNEGNAHEKGNGDV